MPRGVVRQEDPAKIEGENLPYGCETDIIVWSAMLTYQDVSSPENEGCGDEDCFIACVATRD